MAVDGRTQGAGGGKKRSREGRVHVQWFHLIALIIRIHGTKYSALLGIKVALH